MRIRESDIPKITFLSRYGHYEIIVLLFALASDLQRSWVSWVELSDPTETFCDGKICWQFSGFKVFETGCETIT